MLALSQAIGPEGVDALSRFPGPELSNLLLAVLIASALGYLLTLRIGALLARRAVGRDLRPLNVLVLLLLAALVLLFNGLPGALVLLASVPLGLLPPRLGVRRVHLTGCLLVPILLFYLGLEDRVIGLLWGGP
jgi:putative membrane protein